MRITDYPDLLRTKGKEPMPQAWDETNQDWTPAIDSAATLKALREALGAPADATQADPVQEATAIALLKGLLELTAMRATDQTLTQIKTALTDGTQQVQLTGKNVELLTAFNAVAITDTSVKTVLLDLSKYSRVQFILRSTLNQKVKIGFKALTNAFSSFWDGAKWQVTNPSTDWLAFPGDSVEYIINSKAPVLDDFIGPQICIMMGCDTAPTSGSVSIFVRGWPN